MPSNTSSADALAHELKAYRDRFGDEALNDRRRVVAILADRMNDAARDIRVIGIIIDNGAVNALRVAGKSGAPLEIDRLAARVDASVGLPRAISLPVLRALAFALDVSKSPSTYRASDASEPSTIAPERLPESGTGTVVWSDSAPEKVVRHRPAVPYGFIPFGLYFTFVEGFIFFIFDSPILFMRDSFRHFLHFLRYPLSYDGSLSLDIFIALQGLSLFLTAVIGVLAVVLAVARKRVFRAAFAVWMPLPLLYFIEPIVESGLPTSIYDTGALVSIAIISGAGVIYAFKSKRLLEFFSR